MELVSIILPTYNGEKYIAKAIESCLQQTYQNIELIVVNDCSTDATAAIVQSYVAKDPRVRLINNSENKKLPTSLNIGFNHAKGTLYSWTSDDNLYAPTAIEEMYAALANSGAGIVYSSYTMIDENGTAVNTYQKDVEELLFNCVTGPCFLYKKEVHDKVRGYDEAKFRAEDMDFWLKAVVHYKIHAIDNSDLYYYRLHQNSLSSDIVLDEEKYRQHKANYHNIFKTFFANAVQLQLTEEELNDYVDIYFFDREYQRVKHQDLSQTLVRYLQLFDKLKGADWQQINFCGKRVFKMLDEKRAFVVQLLMDNLQLENKILSQKKPQLAKGFSKNISWYYKEYEVLPSWYKKIGHFIKIVQGNRSLKSLNKKEG